MLCVVDVPLWRAKHSYRGGPTECGVSDCDLETTVIRFRPYRAVEPWTKKKKSQCVKKKSPISSHKITEILFKKKNDNKGRKRDREQLQKKVSRCSIDTTYKKSLVPLPMLSVFCC